ncbi:hypothetical protein GCM10027098_38780 [Bowmanella dokdonensis]
MGAKGHADAHADYAAGLVGGFHQVGGSFLLFVVNVWIWPVKSSINCRLLQVLNSWQR